MTRPEPVDPEHVYQALKADLDRRTTWDQAPVIGQVITRRAKDGPAVALRRFKLPLIVWATAPVPQALTMLAISLAGPAGQIDPQMARELHLAVDRRCIGAYIVTEAYATPPEQTIEYLRRMQAGGSVPRPSELRDRLEVRTIAAMLFGDERHYSVSEYRDRPDLGGRADALTGAGSHAPTGLLTDAMRLFTAALEKRSGRTRT